VLVVGVLVCRNAEEARWRLRLYRVSPETFFEFLWSSFTAATPTTQPLYFNPRTSTPPHSRPTMNCARSLAAQSLRLSLSPAARTVTSRGLRTRTQGSTAEQTAEDAAKMRTIEGMPFQTYQLALDVIKKDRIEKIAAVNAQREKIMNVLKKPGMTPDSQRVREMRSHLEYLRVQSDMNNPRVKYNFDIGISAEFRWWWLGGVADCYSWYAEAGLQIPFEPEMEGIPTTDPHAATYPDARSSRFAATD